MTTPRKYTVEELQKMRKAVLRMLPLAISTDEAQISLLVEAKLQSYILSGVDPDELEQASEDHDMLEDARDI